MGRQCKRDLKKDVIEVVIKLVFSYPARPYLISGPIMRPQSFGCKEVNHFLKTANIFLISFLYIKQSLRVNATLSQTRRLEFCERYVFLVWQCPAIIILQQILDLGSLDKI